MLLKYIYFCLYINFRYLIIYDYTDLIRHFDAFYVCCSDDLFIKYLYVDHKIYILLVDNISLTFKLIKKIVNFVFHEIDSNATFVKTYWMKKYFDRNLDLKRWRQHFIVVHKKNANWISMLKQYFNQLKNFINEYDIQLSDTWNMNEINF